MNALRVIKSLGPIDALSVCRDALLRWIVVLPIGIALLVRFFLPVIIRRLEETLHIRLAEFYPAVAGYALLIMAPVMCGMVIGFLLLDERDDRTLLALRVTPLPLGTYLAWRSALPMLLSVGITLVAFPLAGLEKPSALQLLASAIAAAPLAPLLALALATFAAKKVQGFALVKAASGILQIVPLIAYFVHSAWQTAFGVIPTYWPARLLWAFQQGETAAWLYLTVGLAYQLLLLALLLRRFNRTVTA
jgi:fluoroquinolone transport system permease protein